MRELTHATHKGPLSGSPGKLIEKCVILFELRISNTESIALFGYACIRPGLGEIVSADYWMYAQNSNPINVFSHKGRYGGHP